jgi:hypothetical protein
MDQLHCYKIVVKSSSDQEMGPWCPSNTLMMLQRVGIWLEGGEVYDVMALFKNMATFIKTILDDV